MIENLLSNRIFPFIGESVIINIPLELTGYSIKIIALNFSFKLISGTYKDISTAILWRRMWRYENKDRYEFWKELVPQAEEVIEFTGYSEYLDKNSEISKIEMKRVARSRRQETASYSLTLDLIYDFYE